MDIQGMAVLVTGGGSGMGAEVARHFAQAGAKVSVLDVNKANADAVAKEIGGLAFECNVADEASAKAAIEGAAAAHGTARVLVNCAGIVRGARVVGRDGPHALDLFSQVINVNLMGTFNMMRLAADAMSKGEVLNDDGERGVIINTASVAAYDGQIGQAAYAASKGAIVALTLPVAREFAGLGIRVMTVAPGLIETPMMAGMPPAVKESLIADTIFPKRLGKPGEFADLALHIVKNPLLNGETIRLDGAVRLKPK